MGSKNSGSWFTRLFVEEVAYCIYLAVIIGNSKVDPSLAGVWLENHFSSRLSRFTGLRIEEKVSLVVSIIQYSSKAT